jgi:hypothetical protein
VQIILHYIHNTSTNFQLKSRGASYCKLRRKIIDINEGNDGDNGDNDEDDDDDDDDDNNLIYTYIYACIYAFSL